MPFVPENRPPRSPKTGYPPQDIALRKAATTRKITGRRKAADGRASARTHRADDTTAGGDPHNASRTASVPAWIFCSNERGISCKPVSCRRTDSNPTGQRHTRAIPDTPDKAPGSLPGGYSKNGSSARRPASHSLSAPPEKSYVRSYNHSTRCKSIIHKSQIRHRTETIITAIPVFQTARTSRNSAVPKHFVQI